MALTLENIEYDIDREPQIARKGRNVAHILIACPAVMGTVEFKGICGKAVGRSDDSAVKIGADASEGKLCQRCSRLYADLIRAMHADTDDPARRMPENRGDVVEAAAPVVADMTEAEQRAEAVRAYYAAGHPVPAEVASLPDPRVSRTDVAGSGEGKRKACPYQGKEPIGGPVLGKGGKILETAEGECPECKGTVTVRKGRVRRHLIGGDREGQVPLCAYKIGKPLKGTDEDGVTGVCPDCRGTVALSDTGMIPSHLRGGVGAPVSKHLKESTLPTVDRDGAPARDAEKTVARQVKAVGGGKTVFRPVGGARGYVRGGDRAESFRGSWGKGQRGHGTTDGSATTGRHDLPPVRPDKGWAATAGTYTLSMTVRAGMDDGVAGKWCPVCEGPVDLKHRGMTRSQRRKHSVKLREWHRAQEEKRAKRAAQEIQQGKRLPRGARKAARKAASIGSSAEGTQAASGRVIHVVCVSPAKEAREAARQSLHAPTGGPELASAGK